METLSNLKTIVFTQYAIEHFLECYDKAQMESDRYLVKLEFLDFIETMSSRFSEIVSYLELQPEKFEVFLSLVRQIKIDSLPVDAICKREKPIKINIYTAVGD